jgi:hypothetical protein
VVVVAAHISISSPSQPSPLTGHTRSCDIFYFLFIVGNAAREKRICTHWPRINPYPYPRAQEGRICHIYKE